MNNKKTLLLAAILILFAMIGFRILYSNLISYIFLMWNTILAVIPYVISDFMKRKALAKYQHALTAMVCVLFLPNALYLISDFQHLKERPNIPFFYDILLMFYTALLGLLLNVLSLRNLHLVSKKYFKINTSNFIIGFIIFLSGFGVYLGRYLRWNSWDILTHPQDVLLDCAYRIFQPHIYYYSWAVSLGYAFVLGFGYLFFIKSMDYDK